MQAYENKLKSECLDVNFFPIYISNKSWVGGASGFSAQTRPWTLQTTGAREGERVLPLPRGDVDQVLFPWLVQKGHVFAFQSSSSCVSMR